jgi:integrase
VVSQSMLDDAGLDDDVMRHSLRHTAATWLMQAGVDLWLAAGWQENYGHHIRISRMRRRARSGGTAVRRNRPLNQNWGLKYSGSAVGKFPI